MALVSEKQSYGENHWPEWVRGRDLEHVTSGHCWWTGINFSHALWHSHSATKRYLHLSLSYSTFFMERPQAQWQTYDFRPLLWPSCLWILTTEDMSVAWGNLLSTRTVVVSWSPMTISFLVSQQSCVSFSVLPPIKVSGLLESLLFWLECLPSLAW